MKILFATKNPSKIEYYAKELEKNNLEVLTIKDLDSEVQVEENGKNAIENAKIKAMAYYKETGLTTIGIDDNLFLENIEEEKQPGTNVRRVNGKRLSDDEMIDYYVSLVKENGGRINAKWVKGVAIYNGKEMKTFSYDRDNFYFVEKPSLKRHDGYPLDSISIIPEFNKYLTELNEEEKKIYKNKNQNNSIIEFIINNL